MSPQPHTPPLLAQRRAGVLLHPTSLPGEGAVGDLGHAAYRFVEFAAAAGFSLWQMLPLGPTHPDRSPYLCLSANACNHTLISLDWLQDKGLLQPVQESVTTVMDEGHRLRLLAESHRRFCSGSGGKALHHAYAAFVEAQAQAHWLDDYALFMVLRAHHNDLPWYRWETALRDREPHALAQFKQRHQEEVKLHRFCQFVFQQQWQELRAYARERGVYLFGDLPLYLSLDSADTWVNRELFQLDADAAPRYVAGVPPDFFSAQGQRWGNPIYNWTYMERDNFSWWHARIQRQLELFDLLRIDHFRGLQAYWRIPALSDSALDGEWIEAPGDALLRSLQTRFGELPLVAENLGMITPDVEALRHKFRLPGMQVLQFAFDGDPDNLHLPHNHRRDNIVYTGTHDNDTIRGWYAQLDAGTRHLVRDYMRLGEEGGDVNAWSFIASALGSVANTCIIPLQDFMELGSEGRMNTPGTCEGNWDWRFAWQQLPYELAPHIRHLCQLYGRCREP